MTWNYFGLTITSYSERSFVVRGEETKKYKEDLKRLGGRWNPRLKGGAGWIFSNKKEKIVEDFIHNVDVVEEVKEEISTNSDSEEKEDIRDSGDESDDEFIIKRRSKKRIIIDDSDTEDESSDDEDYDSDEEGDDLTTSQCVLNTMTLLMVLMTFVFMMEV